MPTRVDRKAPVTSESKSLAALKRAERERMAGLRIQEPRELRLMKKRDLYYAQKAKDPEGLKARYRRAAEKRRLSPQHSQWHREYNLKTRFGITQEDYESMLAAIPGCAICGHAPAPGERRLVVDHNHKTGRVRGLLCSECNFGIGKFEDKPELLIAAIEYLREPGDNNMLIEIERKQGD